MVFTSCINIYYLPGSTIQGWTKSTEWSFIIPRQGARPGQHLKQLIIIILMEQKETREAYPSRLLTMKQPKISFLGCFWDSPFILKPSMAEQICSAWRGSHSWSPPPGLNQRWKQHTISAGHGEAVSLQHNLFWVLLLFIASLRGEGYPHLK